MVGVDGPDDPGRVAARVHPRRVGVMDEHHLQRGRDLGVGAAQRLVRAPPRAGHDVGPVCGVRQQRVRSTLGRRVDEADPKAPHRSAGSAHLHLRGRAHPHGRLLRAGHPPRPAAVPPARTSSVPSPCQRNPASWKRHGACSVTGSAGRASETDEMRTPPADWSARAGATCSATAASTASTAPGTKHNRRPIPREGQPTRRRVPAPDAGRQRAEAIFECRWHDRESGC